MTANASEDVKPYLLASNGKPWREAYGGDFYVDALIDRWGFALCMTCLETEIPREWSMGSAHEHHPKVVIVCDGQLELPRLFWFTRLLTDAERARAHAYLAEPRCTPERHAPAEARSLRNATEARDRAQAALNEIASRRPGWSIKARATPP